MMTTTMYSNRTIARYYRYYYKPIDAYTKHNCLFHATYNTSGRSDPEFSHSPSNITLYRSAESRENECSKNLRSITRELILPNNDFPSIRAEIIKSDGKPIVLCTRNYFGKQIRNHFFGHTMQHQNFSNSNVASN